MQKSQNKIPVFLTFDLDGEISTRMAAQVNEPGISDPEMGAYGPQQGYKLILKLLESESVPAAFQIVGKIAEMYPNTIRDIHRHGHELAVHSYTHRDYQTLTYEEIDEEIRLTKTIIKELTGEIAVGHRSPYWRQSRYLPELLSKHGITWSSDAHIKFDDQVFLHPYFLTDNILEFPSSERLDDWTCLLTRQMKPNDVAQIWQKMILLSHEQQAPFVLVMHPFIIGQIPFLPILETVIPFIKSQPEKFYFSRPKDYALELTKS